MYTREEEDEDGWCLSVARDQKYALSFGWNEIKPGEEEEEVVQAQMKCNPRCRESDSLAGWELLR